MVARIDSSDDSRLRFIVWHYAYDPERHERRNIEVVAFDDEAEFRTYLETAADDLERRQRKGAADPREHFSGIVKEPGHDARIVARRELGWRLRNGTATEDDFAAAPSFGFLVVRTPDDT